MPVENEVKFRVENLDALRKQLRRLGFKQVTRSTPEFNQLYDFPFGTLRNRGEILRLRHYGKDFKLTFKAKGKSGKHKSRMEIESNVSDGDQMHELLLALGLRPTFAYEKNRAEYASGKGAVVLDETPIGDFAEIEGPARWLDGVARELGISHREYITTSYPQLFQQWKRAGRKRAANMTWKECGISKGKSRRGK